MKSASTLARRIAELAELFCCMMVSPELWVQTQPMACKTLELTIQTWKKGQIVETEMAPFGPHYRQIRLAQRELFVAALTIAATVTIIGTDRDEATSDVLQEYLTSPVVTWVGNTPLHCVLSSEWDFGMSYHKLEEGQVLLISRWLQLGASPYRRNDNGLTPMHMLMIRPSSTALKLIKVCQQYQVHMDVRDFQQRTIKQYAELWKQRDLRKQMLMLLGNSPSRLECLAAQVAADHKILDQRTKPFPNKGREMIQIHSVPPASPLNIESNNWSDLMRPTGRFGMWLLS